MKLARGIEPTKGAIDNYKKTLNLINTLVGDNHYLVCDHLTIADLSLLATLSMLAASRDDDLENQTDLKKWFHSMQKQLPYYEQVNDNVIEQFRLWRDSVNNWHKNWNKNLMKEFWILIFQLKTNT